MRRKLFALLAALAFTLPVFAQDTPEPTAPPVVVATDEAPSVAIDVNVPAAPGSDGETVTVPSWLMQNYLLLLPLLTIGAMAFQSWQHGRSIKYALEQMDKRSQDAVEAAHEALPDAAKDAIQFGINLAERIVDELGGIVAWAKRVTDGQPNTEPPDAAESTDARSLPHR